MAWAEEAPSPLAQLLRGIADAFRALPLPPAQLAAGLRQIAAVQACAPPCGAVISALHVIHHTWMYEMVELITVAIRSSVVHERVFQNLWLQDSRLHC